MASYTRCHEALLVPAAVLLHVQGCNKCGVQIAGM
jgi:hypothetical protein